MPEIKWIAVIVATAAAFVLGGLWYGPLFSKPWMREMGYGLDFKPVYPKLILFGVAIGVSFICALVFAAFVGPAPSSALAIGAGLAVGLGWVAPCMITTYLFANRSITLLAIDVGYPVVQFTLYGLVFALLG
jgi:hypothetical protein